MVAPFSEYPDSGRPEHIEFRVRYGSVISLIYASSLVLGRTVAPPTTQDSPGRIFGRPGTSLTSEKDVMKILSHISIIGFAASIALGSAVLPPAGARAEMKIDCSSNRNLWHVHRRLEGVIENLDHDQHDYGGHRDAAIGDLQNARAQIVAAEQYAVGHDGDNPACFRTSGGTGGTNIAWGVRSQGGSNLNIAGVTNWVGRLISQLNSDQRDYGGHRANAVSLMHTAQGQLQQAEQYAQAHPH